MKVKIFIILIISVLLIIFGLTLYKKGFIPSALIMQNNTRIGMLEVVINCMIPEGCGPKYRLSNSGFTGWVGLLGNINNSDNGMIIEVFGYETKLPDNQKSMLNNEKDMKAIRVIKYKVLSKISDYHSFLMSESEKYMLKRFGCTCKWPNDCKFKYDGIRFSWEYKNNEPILKVKWIQDSKFVELWYDGNSGEFIKEIVSPPDAIFCSN